MIQFNIINDISHSIGRYRYNCYIGKWGGERYGICSYGYRNVIAHSTRDSKSSINNNNLGIDIGAEIRNKLWIERLRKGIVCN